MASGFGINKIGRCYRKFSAFETCMNQEMDSKVCNDFRDTYFKCLHLPTIGTLGEHDLRALEDAKDTLVLAANALDSQPPASSDPPAPAEGEGSST